MSVCVLDEFVSLVAMCVSLLTVLDECMCSSSLCVLYHESLMSVCVLDDRVHFFCISFSKIY